MLLNRKISLILIDNQLILLKIMFHSYGKVVNLDSQIELNREIKIEVF